LNASCILCASGFFGSPMRPNGDTACYTCPPQVLQIFYYHGDVNSYQPTAVSQPGARSSAACLPEFTAVSEPNWSLPSAASMVNASAAVARNATRAEALEACLEACRQAGPGCQFVSYDYSSRSCQLRVAAAGADGR
jgi:hypothetical protein